MSGKDELKYFPTEKDFERMLDLIDKDLDGKGVAKLIKDKNKAINRWVAGALLAGATEDFFPELTFSDFYNKALELGATKEELKDKFIAAKANFDKDSYKVKRSINYIDYVLSKEGFHVEREKKNVISRNKYEFRSGARWNIRTLLKIYDNKGHYVFLDYDDVTDEGDFSRWRSNSIYELFNVEADDKGLLYKCLSGNNVYYNRYLGHKFKMRNITKSLLNYFHSFN